MNRVVCTLELTMMLMMKHEVVNLKKASQTRDTARDLAWAPRNQSSVAPVLLEEKLCLA